MSRPNLNRTGYMLRISLADKPVFEAAAREDGYDDLAPWFRWLARARIRQQKPKILTPPDGH